MTTPQKKAMVADQQVEVEPIEAGNEAETPTPKRTKAKAPTAMSKGKANAYVEAEDALLLALVAEHGRADGLRQFVVQNCHRTQYGAECRLHRLTQEGRGMSGYVPDGFEDASELDLYVPTLYFAPCPFCVLARPLDGADAVKRNRISGVCRPVTMAQF